MGSLLIPQYTRKHKPGIVYILLEERELRFLRHYSACKCKAVVLAARTTPHASAAARGSTFSPPLSGPTVMGSLTSLEPFAPHSRMEARPPAKKAHGQISIRCAADETDASQTVMQQVCQVYKARVCRRLVRLTVTLQLTCDPSVAAPAGDTKTLDLSGSRFEGAIAQDRGSQLLCWLN